MARQFWVVGGPFRDMTFSSLKEGGAELYGPFRSYREAHDCWRERAETTRAIATTRYTVVADALRAKA
jgi:hypothetical protein